MYDVPCWPGDRKGLLLGVGAGCAFAFGAFFLLVPLLFFVLLLAAG